MCGGLLRLTNYGNATGRRFDDGAMITLAGGGIEMDGASAIQDQTANYTRAAVVVKPPDNSPGFTLDVQRLVGPRVKDVDDWRAFATLMLSSLFAKSK